MNPLNLGKWIAHAMGRTEVKLMHVDAPASPEPGVVRRGDISKTQARRLLLEAAAVHVDCTPQLRQLIQLRLRPDRYKVVGGGDVRAAEIRVLDLSRKARQWRFPRATWETVRWLEMRAGEITK